MTFNPHMTDQLLAAAAENAALRPPRLDLAPTIIDMLREGLPGIDDKLLGEVVLHAAACTARLAMVLEQRGYHPAATGPVVSTVLAEAGAQLYREATS